MWLRATGHAIVLYQGDTAKLDAEYFDTPFPAALSDDVRKIVDYLAIADRAPFGTSQCAPDLTGACVCDGVFKIRHFKKSLADVGYSPSDDCVKAHCVSVYGGRAETGKVLSPRRYVLVEHRVYVERNAPVESRFEFTFESAQPAKNSLLERVQNYERDQRLKAGLDDLPEAVKHETSSSYPWG